VRGSENLKVSSQQSQYPICRSNNKVTSEMITVYMCITNVKN
jgi:hypothetical protein